MTETDYREPAAGGGAVLFIVVALAVCWALTIGLLVVVVP